MELLINMTKSLADGSRMRVVAALLSRNELCVCQIVELLQLAAGTVSRHMSILQNACLVQSRKDGRWVYYRLSGQFPDQLRKWLTESLLSTKAIQADKILLEKILSCAPEDLCQNQKKRKELR